MRSLFVTFLLFAFYGTPKVYGQELVYPLPSQQMIYQPSYQSLYPPTMPQRLYVPQVQMIPYDYQRTEVTRRLYRTPFRDLLFGRYKIYDYYAPATGVNQ